MSFFRLLFDNLLFHRRGNFAVFLGVALGTAVLTGAMLVGDSLSGSLEEQALEQLGWVNHALTAPRFFRARLADELRDFHACPALLLKGSAGVKGQSLTRTVAKVNVLGIDHRFWQEVAVPAGKDFWQSNDGKAMLNQSLAEALHVKKGDTILLNVQKAENQPREVLLGKRRREDVVAAIEVKVHDILPDRGLARFTLQPSPEPVRNAFVPLRFLQQNLGLTDRANALLARGGDPTDALKEHLRLEDWGLKLLSPNDRAEDLARLLVDPKFMNWQEGVWKVKEKFGWADKIPDALASLADMQHPKKLLRLDSIKKFYREQRNYFLLESDQLLLEDAVVDAVQTTFLRDSKIDRPIFQIGTQDWWLCPMLIYLADSISDGKSDMSYAVVTGRGPLPDDTGPPLEKDQIDLAKYEGSRLSAKAGDTVTVSYFAPDDHNHLQKLHEKFKVRKVFPLQGRFDDPDLVPKYPGITDKLDIGQLDPKKLPFPYEKKRGGKETQFWTRYRTTPRAYVSLETAQRLWGSRFGNLTSYQVVSMSKKPWNDDSEAAMLIFRKRLLEKLDPEKGGFVWQNVRQQAMKAGVGSTDFGMFFVMFSFFLIVAALMLVGLLFRLNLDLRGREIGVLLATGWTFPRVRWLLLCEGGLLAILGALLGLGGALGYADLLLKYLSAKWPGEQKLEFLRLHPSARSLAIGWASSVAVSFLTILWATRILGKMTPTRLLAGDTTASAVDVSGRRCYSHWVILGSLLMAAALLAMGLVVHEHMAQALSFFGSGFLLLVAACSYVWRRLRFGARHGNPRQSLAGLAVRNAGRHAVRSVLTVGLLASATFLIVAVESFHKEAGKEFLEKTGGSGGFPLYAQADVPIFEDLNQDDVRKKLTFPPGVDPKLSEVRFYPCRLQGGDDASCLNLYQPQLKPRILGVPQSLIDRGGFSFGSTLAKTVEEKANPWVLLARPQAADDDIPMFVDGTSAEYILHKKLGGTYEITDGQGKPVKLRIVGLLQDSVFQSEMVISAANFRRLFPRQEGFAFFLIDAPIGHLKEVKEAWENALIATGKEEDAKERVPLGLSIETTTSRLQKYLAVENTYLATFQALGALGLLLGAAGLAIVLLRSVWERRGELALLRALGFRRLSLAWLVLVENAFLLLVGLAVGTVSALLAVAPHLVGGEAHLLGLRVLELLGLVIAVGLAAGLAAVFTTLRAPLLQALRQE